MLAAIGTLIRMFIKDLVIQVAAVHCKTSTVLLLWSEHTIGSKLAGTDRL